MRTLRAAWPDVKLTIRGGSGFCRWRRRRWCDAHSVGSVLGWAQNLALLREARPWTEAARWLCAWTGQPQRLFGTWAYAAETWDRWRRVLVKAEHTAQGANPRFLVTNVPGDSQELEEDGDWQRREMENRVKEQQLELFADRPSCHRFLAHQFRVLLSWAA